jgi:RNA polymerase sigma-70 factor (ECF subfamily)
MLQAVLGLDARRMAAAFLVEPAALGQRLARAKARIAGAGIPFALPEGAEREARLADVLTAVYAAHAVGSDGIGAGDGKAAGLAGEALWLASLVAGLLPAAAEAQALLALLLFTEARRPAARDAEGRFVPLERQDPALWDARMLEDARRALVRATFHASLGRFQLEAAIQSVHVARRETGATDWPTVLALYDGLVQVTGALGAACGRAAALAEVEGAAAGLAALEALPAERDVYQPWWAVRAHLLARQGRGADAAEAFAHAAAMTADPALRVWLLAQRAAPH